MRGPKVAVVTPTYRFGGMDVNYASLVSQSRPPDVWVVADDLYESRRELVSAMTEDAPFAVDHFMPRKKPPGYHSDLAHIYNAMSLRAMALGCEFIVSLQDYMWIGEDGIRDFVNSYMALGDVGRDMMITGIADHAGDPIPEEVVHPEGLWTVFAAPYDGTEPTFITWEDVRFGPTFAASGGRVIGCSPIWWELNWAAWSADLHVRGAWFPEHYGEGIAHENSAFAIEAMERGGQCWIDPMNRAVCLPHKAYWPEHERSGGPKSVSNMEMFWAEYGDRLAKLSGGGIGW